VTKTIAQLDALVKELFDEINKSDNLTIALKQTASPN
jgi:hypothetical protein